MKTWIKIDETNLLRWYRIVDFLLDEKNTVQVLLACTEETKHGVLTMVMRQRYPDGSTNGVYAHPTDIIMCVQKADEFMSGMKDSGFKISTDSGNVYIPDGMDAVEYLKDSVHFNVIESARTEEAISKDLSEDEPKQ